MTGYEPTVQRDAGRLDLLTPELIGCRLAIADPPYPPSRAAGGSKRRASRWYGRGVAASDRQADVHPHSSEWDNAARHRELLLELMVAFDGWAIATSADGLEAYGPLPAASRVMVWLKPNAMPGAHRLRSMWEAVIVYPPAGRRSNRGGRGQVPDVLTCPAPRIGFTGAKPPAWTEWVLAALCYDASTDELVDMFPGSGAVSLAAARVARGEDR